MATAIRIDVYGAARAKGSASAGINRATGRAFISAFGFGAKAAELRAWEATVRAYARDVVGDRAPPFVGQALLAVLTFFIPRPRNHYGTGRNADVLKPSAPLYPDGKPDADKLARSTLDPLTAIVYDDDCRVVELLARKRWAKSADDAGATIVVDVMDGRA